MIYQYWRQECLFLVAVVVLAILDTLSKQRDKLITVDCKLFCIFRVSQLLHKAM